MDRPHPLRRVVRIVQAADFPPLRSRRVLRVVEQDNALTCSNAVRVALRQVPGPGYQSNPARARRRGKTVTLQVSRHERAHLNLAKLRTLLGVAVLRRPRAADPLAS